MEKIRTIDSLPIESSVLCCNFVNTVYAWRGVNLNEYLKGYGDVIDWCRKLGVYDACLTYVFEEAAEGMAGGATCKDVVVKSRMPLKLCFNGILHRRGRSL
jgi:hypothetical protein